MAVKSGGGCFLTFKNRISARNAKVFAEKCVRL